MLADQFSGGTNSRDKVGAFLADSPRNRVDLEAEDSLTLELEMSTSFKMLSFVNGESLFAVEPCYSAIGIFNQH